MANLKTDSPLARRIVRSFFHFLNSVEPSPGVDLEGLEVAKECLADVFKIDPVTDISSKPDSLVEIFHSRESTEQCETKSYLSPEKLSADAPSSSSAPNTVDDNNAETSQSMDTGWTSEAHNEGISKDELFGQFFDVLEKIHYFKTMPDGNDDQVQLDRATRIFHNAIAELEKSGRQTYDRKNLADILKSQGNKGMQMKQYTDAIELYTFAIALFEDNAVFYCNRAAAYTQINQYSEAIRDCLKSIEIDPNYGKAYSRLGFAYYAQGNYRDAIDRGFMKALQLDPTNNSVKENIRVAEQKLIEELRRTEPNQSSSGHQRDSNQQSAGGSTSDAMPPQFTSMPFAANGIPIDITNMLRNITGNIYPGTHSQEEPRGTGDNDESIPDPEIRLGGNININLGDQMPEELSGALRSVMQMFSGAAPSDGNSQDNLNGRSAPS